MAKEEFNARIQVDLSDRKNIQEKLENCIDPLDLAGYSLTLFIIVSRKLTDASLNVQKAVHIDMNYILAYKDKIPKCFRNKMCSPVANKATT